MGNELLPLTPDTGYVPGTGLEGFDEDKRREAAVAAADVLDRAAAPQPPEPVPQVPDIQQGGVAPSEVHALAPAGSTPAPATAAPATELPGTLPAIPEPPAPPALTGDPQKDVAANLQHQRALADYRTQLLGHKEKLDKVAADIASKKAKRESDVETANATARAAELAAFAEQRKQRQTAIDDAVKAKASAARDIEGADWMQRNTGAAIAMTILGTIGQAFNNAAAANLGQVGHAENEGIKTINSLVQRDYDLRKNRLAQAGDALLQARYGFKDAADNHRAAMNDLDADLAAKYRLIAKDAENELKRNGADQAAIQNNLLRTEALQKAADAEGKIHDRQEAHDIAQENAKAMQGIARANLGERRAEFRSREEDRRAAATDKAEAKKAAAADKEEARTVRDPDTGQPLGLAPSPRNVDKLADAISKTNMYVDAVNRLADHIDKHGRILNPLSDEGKERQSLAADVQAMGRGIKGIQASDAGQRLEHQIIGGTGTGIERMANPKVLRDLAEQARKGTVQHLTSALTPVPGESKARVPSGSEPATAGRRVRLKSGETGTLAPDGTFTPDK